MNSKSFVALHEHVSRKGSGDALTACMANTHSCGVM